MKICMQCNRELGEEQTVCSHCGLHSQQPEEYSPGIQDPKVMNLMRACYFGTLTFYQGDYDRAIADYSELIQVEPFQSKKYGPNPAVFFNRGQAYRHKGEYDKAIASYQIVVTEHPDFVLAEPARRNITACTAAKTASAATSASPARDK